MANKLIQMINDGNNLFGNMPIYTEQAGVYDANTLPTSLPKGVSAIITSSSAESSFPVDYGLVITFNSISRAFQIGVSYANKICIRGNATSPTYAWREWKVISPT